MSKGDRFRQLLELLRQKSLEGQVHWQLQPTTENATGKTVRRYVVEFSNKASIELIHEPSFSDEITAKLIIGRREIESIYADQNFEEFKLLWALVEEAERCTTQWDKAIDEIEQELSSANKVGVQTVS